MLSRGPKEITIRLRKLHPAQRLVQSEATRYNVLACGRRWGKTCFAEDRIASICLDQRGRYGYFTPNYKLLLEVWEDLLRTFKPVIKRSNATDRRIELLTGGLIEMWSFEAAEVARSRKYNEVFIDEAGLIPDLLRRWHEEILPTLADCKGSAWFAGTPKGRNGFYTLWQRGQDGSEADWRSWRYPTVSNPHIDPAEVAQMAREMPERSYRQEIEAEFLEDGAGVFRGVAALSTLHPTAPADGHIYVMGCDWGRTDDYTVASVIDCSTWQQVALERFTDTGYELQRARLTPLFEAYRPRAIVAETNSMGGPIVERLQRDGWPVFGFNTSNSSKLKLIDDLVLCVERRSLDLLNDKVQVSELEAYASETLPSGMIRYSAPEGQHDDTVMALALAWHGTVPYRIPIQYGEPLTEPEQAQADFSAIVDRLASKPRPTATGW